MKLNQLLAILKGVKSKSSKGKTELYQLIQKEALFQGLSRTYRPRDEEGFVYPPESQKVVKKANDILAGFEDYCTELWDLAATQDKTNAKAKASVVVDGVTILEDVPVTFLLFLEKQLTDVLTFVQSLPKISFDKDWHRDANRGYYATAPKETVKTKKITEFVVAYEATEHHPAQVKEVTKDIVEGVWSLTEFSGGLPSLRIAEISRKVEKLQQAVVKAREAANATEVEPIKVGEILFKYILEQV